MKGLSSKMENSPVTPEKEMQLVQLLLKNSLFLQREMNLVCRRFGIKQQQFSVLNEVVWHGPVSQKAVGEALFMEKSNVSKIVSLLLDKALIRADVSPGDRRLTLLSETPAGHDLWERCLEALETASAGLMTLLSDDDAGSAIRFLKRLQRAFKIKQMNKGDEEP